MTSPFTAGRKLRVSELAESIPLFCRQLTAQTVNNSATFVDVTGLTIALKANRVYAIDGYLAYSSNTTADIKFRLIGPTGCSGAWGLYSIASGSADGGSGSVNGFRLTDYTTGGGGFAASGNNTPNGNMSCPPRGFIQTGVNAGTLKLQFAQSTANGSDTTVAAGSWLRVAELAEII